ncbi:uncharacterized protein KY384_001538 [Bacidia gigantensis]|uniref:uncharacterized protein n=1 Tax=Bacidia gigantensis TaxID=2732470 RepID=UPI001D043D1F|nr:uncharacterized protein KY384_001538 [Bacidia gigantensis]KAG8533797.1 hypothetical protein KY384_001538 [Bacidia gigantensis]
MSLMSEKLGRLLRRQDGAEKTPPKALYSDLESAYESITSKSSSTFSKSQISLPLDQSATRTNSPPVPFFVANAYTKFQSSDENLSQWQTVASTSVAGDNTSHVQGGRKLALDIRSDTVDDILERYTESVPEGLSYHFDKPCRTATPCTRDSRVQSRFECEEMGNLERFDLALAQNVEQSINTGAQSPSRIVGRKRTKTSSSLDQFAWSPCPSEADANELHQADDDLHDHVVIDLNTSDVLSSHAGASSSSPESYGNTRELLQLSSSRPSGKTSSYRVTPHELLRVRNSRLAGDLHVSWPCQQRAPSLQRAARISGVVSDGSSSRPMSGSEVLGSLSDIVRSVLRSRSLSATSSSVGKHGCAAEKPKINRETTMTLLGQYVGDVADLTPSTSEVVSDYRNLQLSNRSSQNLGSHVQVKTRSGSFERHAGKFLGIKPAMQSPLTRKNSRLAQAAAAAGVKESGRLGRALASPSEQDWVTETDVTTSGETRKSPYFETITGSSLADNSEMAGFLTSERHSSHKMQHSTEGASGYPNHARYNLSWSVMRNVRNGSLMLGADHVTKEGKLLPDSLTMAQVNFLYHDQVARSLEILLNASGGPELTLKPP